jgi:phosphoribosylaminoimidazole (AIR) synthetase
MLKTLNCGIGMVFVVSPQDRNQVHELIVKNGFTAFDIGEVKISASSAEAQIVY